MIPMNTRPIAPCTAALLSAITLATHVTAASVSLSGSDADGYLAVVGFNSEDGSLDPVTTSGGNGLSDDPSDGKFYDYPAYINPNNSGQIYVMMVEPYRFGLSYPTSLHPTGSGTFADVGTLQQRNPDNTAPAGATFVEGFTEDADFSQFNIGGINYADGLVTGVGTEVVSPSQVTLALDGTEFEGINRTDGFAGDSPPFGPEGRSNFNEMANQVAFNVASISGTGLTFEDGVLTSIDMVAEVSVQSTNAWAYGVLGVPGAEEAYSWNAAGTLTFSGDQFAFDIDEQDSIDGVANFTRIILNRNGTLDAVGGTIPEPTSAVLLATASLGLLSRRRRSA